MAEESLPGGTQSTTNEDKQISGYIDTGVDSARVLLDSTATILSLGLFQVKGAVSSLNACLGVLKRILTHHKHIHQFHKHRSCKGHCRSSLFLKMTLRHSVFIMSGGKYFAGGHQNTVVNLLMNEMMHNRDLDDNGKIFFHDFIFDWDDPKIPPGLRKLKNNPFMPGNTIFPHDEESYKISFMEYLIDYLDNCDVYGHRKPKLINRDKECIILSWDEYYSGINPRYKEYLVI